MWENIRKADMNNDSSHDYQFGIHVLSEKVCAVMRRCIYMT